MSKTTTFTSLLILALMGNATVTNMVIAANSYGPTKTGDMLWNIATKIRPSSISRYQVMIALLRANPHAFRIPCNLNTLKIGQTLYIPSQIDMQAFSRAKAIREFNRQQREWKMYRRQKQVIVCSPPTDSAVINQPVRQTALFSTPVTFGEKNGIQNVNQEKMDDIKSMNIEKTISSLISSTWDDVLSWLSAQLPFPITTTGLLMIIVLLLLVLLIGKWMRKYVTNRTVVTKKHFFDESFDKTSPVDGHSNSEKSPLIFGKSTATSTGDSTPAREGIATNNRHNDMKEKLDNVRAYLAEDGAQTTQRMLREVIQKGNPKQQQEARQLYEINKKMESLKHGGKKTLEPRDRHLQSIQQHFPEEPEKVLELVDKIFELLDYELDAQGKLIDAYVTRQHSGFSKTKNYEIVEKAETFVVDNGNEDDLSKASRSEPEPTRHL